MKSGHLRRTRIFWIFAGLCVCALTLNSIAGAPGQVDRIVIVRSKRTMSLMSASEVLKTYKVALGGQPAGAKDRQGDHKTPEGIYSVD
jgi:murein L,D-transpeptidase YafK